MPPFVTGKTGKYYVIVMTLQLIVVQCQGFSGGVLMFAEKIFVDLRLFVYHFVKEMDSQNRSCVA